VLHGRHGFTLIGLEMLLLLAFQAIYGYVYQQLAVIIAAFMAGVALGAGWRLDRAGRGPAPQGVQCHPGVAASRRCSCSTATVRGVRSRHPSAVPGAGTRLRECWRLRVSGASRIFCARNPGTLYALDLAGSCLGAVLFSVYLIPVFGFLKRRCWRPMVSLGRRRCGSFGGRKTSAVKRKMSVSASCSNFGQAGFVTGLLQEGGAVPLFFDGPGGAADLRLAPLHDEAMLSDADLLDVEDPAERRKDRDFVLEAPSSPAETGGSGCPARRRTRHVANVMQRGLKGARSRCSRAVGRAP